MQGFKMNEYDLMTAHLMTCTYLSRVMNHVFKINFLSTCQERMDNFQETKVIYFKALVLCDHQSNTTPIYSVYNHIKREKQQILTFEKLHVGTMETTLRDIFYKYLV